MNLNVQNWKEFKIGRLYTLIEAGKCSDASSLTEGDDINYIGAKRNDNGVMKRVTRENNLVSRGNCIAFICQGEGSAGYATYQDKDFIGATSLKLGYIDGVLNPNIGNFLATLHCLEKPKYNYGRGWGKTLQRTVVKLPIQRDSHGNPLIDKTFQYSDEGYIPDWQFMEDYIKSLHYKPLTTQRKRSNKIELNVKDWKEYRVDRLFTVALSKGDIKADDMDSGTVRLVSAGETDNGIVAYIDCKGDGKAKIFDSNVMTADMFCNAYYQNESFYAVSHGRVNILLPKFKLNSYIGLFISTLINNERYKYSYGRALYSNVVGSMVLKLPTLHNIDNNLIIDESRTYSNEGYIPDWQFMEDYIKSLPYGDRII